MNNRRDLEDHEEAMGENQHHEGNSPPGGISPMKNISPSVLPHFYGKVPEDPDKFIFEFDILCHSYGYTTNAQKLKFFPTTLKDNALRWFMSLARGTVATWD